jgi:hypothetical protein
VKVSRGTGGDSQSSTAGKRSLGVEWKLFRPAKEGGKTAAEEIELKPD